MNDVMRNAYDETFKVQALIKSFGPKSVISIAKELGIPDSALYRWRSNDDLMAKARAKKMQLELEKTVGNTRSESEVVDAISKMARNAATRAEATEDLDLAKRSLDLLMKASNARKQLIAEAEASYEPLDPSKIR